MNTLNLTNPNLANNKLNFLLKDNLKFKNTQEKQEFLNKKTNASGNLNDDQTNSFNFKKRKTEKFGNMKEIEQKLTELKSLNNVRQTSEKTSVVKSSVVSPISSSHKLNQNQNSGVNFYFENRLNSMSHIKLINPKYRNSIIPVLPGAFNKF